VWLPGYGDILVQPCRKIRRSISLPIVLDFEQGFGEPYVSVFWLNELERAGVGASAMAKALKLELKTGKISSLRERHGNVYDLLESWMNVEEVRRIRESYVKKI
jgi:2-methylisocitrate lyase-like PEP mutase family enzyme